MTYLTSRSSGISILSLLFLFLFWIDNASAQVQIKPNLASFSQYSPPQKTISAPDDLKIIGVMVEFLPDTNRFTSGNGTFGPGSIPYLEDPGTNIDALPHDHSYFEAHLEFTKNYFETVSGGKISIDFEVLPEVYQLNKRMEEYSPTGENPDLSSMAELVTDAWTMVGESNAIINNFTEADNIAFVIFHAGVGRDIELTGTNLDKTPQDLPSFYLSRETLSRFLDDPSFSGFPINNGNLLVSNSLIIPRTLTRAGTDAADDRFLLSLSINGLLTAQIGSHLGLPDLFDTNTGQSGIGRFGLMDGAGIFSYNGLFPPELSAWEKTYLGWSVPFSVEYDEENPIHLPAANLHQEQSISKVSISNEEYFLIENRHRDPDGNGITLTIKKNDGSYVQQTFTNNDTEFTNQEFGFDELLEPGVVVSASNYDFSLPGGFISDLETDDTLNGGILIWHIDEGIIREKMDTGGVNNNADRRGIDLEEADGAQDIGRPTSIGLFQNEVNGSPYDFWWSGNNASVIIQSDTLQFYNNRFSPETTPTNNSNSGAPSYFEIYNISDNLPVASFEIRPVQPFPGIYELWDSKSDMNITAFSDAENEYWKRYPLAVQTITVVNNDWILIPGYDGIQFYQPNDKHLSEQLISVNTLQQPFINNDLFTVAGLPGETGNIELSIYQFHEESISEESQFTIQSNSAFISSFETNILDIDGTTDRIDLSNNEILSTNNAVQFSEKIGDYQSKIENGSLILNHPGGSETFVINQKNEDERFYTGLIQAPNDQVFFYLLEDGQLSVFSPDENYQTKKVIHKSGFIDWPAFVDFNQDSQLDFLFIDYTSNQVIAKNKNGAFLPSFPISAPAETRFTGTPIVADLNGDNNNEFIITGYDNYSMNLYAFDQHGELIDGFPLYVGGIENEESQPIHPLISGNKLIAVSHTGDLKVWEFKNLKNLQWKSKYGNQTRNKISGFINSDAPSNPQLSLLNDEETYNWPNPATDETQIRFQTREPAEIQIKILTMSGRVIGNHTFQSKGGIAEEILLDTSSWASGGYFALIEAKSDGITERKLIKIAIAR
ncbi:T9SS type A sorting domain-containing protein [Rhodohalobacter sp. 614A]|uniref:T9SS-dependent M6-like inactivated metalloprotease n=1 Tax=Rhodohalobacter sp. 614A TaxID=2908649 RepID=UPI001F2AD0C2|nr:T9SS type A sorting domain-containing protein [Rhodohalobacter sp. 614A]